MTKVGGVTGVVAALLAGVGAAPAQATPEQVQALRSCISLSTTGKDRIVAARWIFAAIGTAPQLADMAKVDPEKRAQANKDMAALFTRLLTVDCLKEAKPVVKDSSGGGMREAGSELGQIAMQELFGGSGSDAAAGEFASYLHKEDFDVLNK